MPADRWATFDCYGTLIDWLGGIRGTLVVALARGRRGRALRALPRHRADRAGRPRHPVPGRDGRDARAGRRGRRTRRSAGARGRARGVVADLAVLPRRSGVACRSCVAAVGSSASCRTPTPDLLDASLTAIGVPVDLRVVASDIGSYKPAFGHWETFFRQTRSRPVAARARRRVPLPRRAAMRRAGTAVRVDQPAGRDERAAAGRRARRHLEPSRHPGRSRSHGRRVASSRDGRGSVRRRGRSRRVSA